MEVEVLSKLPSHILQYWANFTNDGPRAVGFPLYRIQVLFYLPPSLLQLFLLRVPESVATKTPNWYHFCFIGLYLVGVICIVAALAMGDTRDSAQLERIGAFIVGGMSFLYFGIAWSHLWPSIPLTHASWGQLGFGTFCLIRVFQIKRRIKSTETVAAIAAENEKRGSPWKS